MGYRIANRLTLPAPAKLNLFLHILGRRSDGYHNLQTVFQLIDYVDHLQFHLRDDGKIKLTIKNNSINSPLDQNLVIRAARLLQQHTQTPYGADIELHKKIPIGAGLGGGSSNAATTLVGLNELWQLHLSEHDLLKLGLSLGADVPVFIYGKTAFAEGIGEQLQPLELPQPWYVILVPPCTIQTQEIFSAPELTRATPPITIRDFLDGRGHNDCENIVRQRYPDVATALDWLNQFAKASLTGTGSCVFAQFDQEQQARQVAQNIPKPFSGFIAKGLNQSPLYAMLG